MGDAPALLGAALKLLARVPALLVGSAIPSVRPMALLSEAWQAPHSAHALAPVATTAVGSMGQVRFVQRGAIEQQLSAGNLVLLTNIGVSSSGELLNCNCFDVRPPC